MLVYCVDLLYSFLDFFFLLILFLAVAVVV